LNVLKPQHPELVEAADVLREVGNQGAHGDAVDRDRLLAAYELFEIELRKLFTDDTARRRTLIDKLRVPKPEPHPCPSRLLSDHYFCWQLVIATNPLDLFADKELLGVIPIGRRFEFKRRDDGGSFPGKLG
jgi:hypothetical protein